MNPQDSAPILAAVDFSATTRGVIDQAVRLAAALGAHLYLVHVGEPDPDFVGYEAGPECVRDAVAGELRKEHRELQALGDEARGSGVEVTALLVQGAAAETILAEAERLGAAMIVMGTRDRGRVHELLAGSVRREVVRKARRPVTLVPPAAG